MKIVEHYEMQCTRCGNEWECNDGFKYCSDCFHFIGVKIVKIIYVEDKVLNSATSQSLDS